MGRWIHQPEPVEALADRELTRIISEGAEPFYTGEAERRGRVERAEAELKRRVEELKEVA